MTSVSLPTFVSRIHERQPIADLETVPDVDLSVLDAPTKTEIRNALAKDTPIQLSSEDMAKIPSFKSQCEHFKALYFRFAAPLSDNEVGHADFLLQRSLDRSFRAVLCDYMLDQDVDPTLVAAFYQERSNFVSKDLSTLTVTSSKTLEDIQKKHKDKLALCVSLKLLNTSCTLFDIPLSSILLQTTDRSALKTMAGEFQRLGLLSEGFKHTTLSFALAQKLFFFCCEHGTDAKPLTSIYLEMRNESSERLTKNYFTKLKAAPNLTIEDKLELDGLEKLFDLMERQKVPHMKVDMLWAFSLDRESFSLALPLTSPLVNPINYRSLFAIWEKQFAVFEGHLQTFIDGIEAEKNKFPRKVKTLPTIKEYEKTLLQLRNTKELNTIRFAHLKGLFANLSDTERHAMILNRQFAQYLNWIGVHLGVSLQISLPAASAATRQHSIHYGTNLITIMAAQYLIAAHGVLENRALLALKAPDVEVYFDPEAATSSDKRTSQEQALITSLTAQVCDEISRRPLDKKESKGTSSVTTRLENKADSKVDGKNTANQAADKTSDNYEANIAYELLVATDRLYDASETRASAGPRVISLEGKRRGNKASSGRDASISSSVSPSDLSLSSSDTSARAPSNASAASLSLEPDREEPIKAGETTTVSRSSPVKEIEPKEKTAFSTLESFKSKMTAVEKAGFKDPMDFIGTLTPAMLSLSQKMRAQLLANPKVATLSADLQKDYERAVDESCDHLLFLMHDIEFIANSFHHGLYDELSSSIQDYMMNLPIAIEQERSADYLLRNKERNRRHSLTALADVTSGGLSTKFQGTIKDHFEAMIWARYPNHSAAKFNGKNPAPLDWHLFASSMAKDGALNGLTRKRASDMITGVIDNTLNTLEHFFAKDFGKDPLFGNLRQTLELLKPFLYKTADQPKAFAAVKQVRFTDEVSKLKKIDKDLTAIINSCHHLNGLRGGNPILNLQDMQHHVKQLTVAYTMTDRYRDSRTACYLARKLFNIDKTFEQIYRSHCIVLDLGALSGHTLKTYHTILRQRGQTTSNEDFEAIEDLNLGNTQHYLHIERGPLSQRMLTLLEQSKAALFKPTTPVAIPDDFFIGLKKGIKLLQDQVALTLPKLKEKNAEEARKASAIPSTGMVRV